MGLFKNIEILNTKDKSILVCFRNKTFMGEN